MKQIKLTQGKISLVDDQDFYQLNQFRWFAHRQPNGRYYAVRNYGDKTIRMHREILKAKTGQLIDHKNRDGLDNRRTNLRFCSRSENAQNAKKRDTGNLTSKLKGIYWNKQAQKWHAKITLPIRHEIYLGTFENEIEAAIAYDIIASFCFGEFARLNFPLKCDL